MGSIAILIALAFICGVGGLIFVIVGAVKLAKKKDPRLLFIGLGLLVLGWFFLTGADQASASF